VGVAVRLSEYHGLDDDCVIAMMMMIMMIMTVVVAVTLMQDIWTFSV